MGLIQKQLLIDKMTCINCQNKIEREISLLFGVQDASVNYQTGIALITYDSDLISLKQIEQKIEDLGYEVISSERPNLSRIISLLAIIIALYVLLQQFGVLNLLVPDRLADSSMGYGMMFVVGLLTSVHCIAMCGGINLSQSLPRRSDETDSQRKSSFLPSALYNLGRVISYTVIGFLLGLIGMLFGGGSGTGIPVMVQGILKLAAGIVMVIMGVNMLGIFPWLRKLDLHIPKSISKIINRKKVTERRPLVIGLLNGLMPCGPLQSMQILALASGSPIAGAVSMLLFSLGTVPLMMGLGMFVSALGKKFAHSVMNIGAVLVAVLGLAMLSQGGVLSGMLPPDRLLLLIIGLAVIGVMVSVQFSRKVIQTISVVAAFAVVLTAGFIWQGFNRNTGVSSDSTVRIVDGVQLVDSTLSPGQYPTIMVQADMPVKWVIHAPDGSINGCNYKMIIREYGIEYSFEEGENLIEFTPTDTGKISYTCWMGMIQGDIIVT